MREKEQKKPSSNYNGVIDTMLFCLLKIALLSVVAWFVLVSWFLGETLFRGQEVTLQRAGQIAITNTHFIAGNSSVLARKFVGWIYLCHEKLFSSIQYFNFLRNPIIQPTINLLFTVTEINVSRIFIFLLAMPLLVLLLFVFATDGLVKRDIRKFQGARESTLTFHRAKKLIGHSFYVPFFIFLCLPVFLSPFLFVLFFLTQGLLLGLVTQLSFAHFKKYV